jgi:hypothetical protein
MRAWVGRKEDGAERPVAGGQRRLRCAQQAKSARKGRMFGKRCEVPEALGDDW